MQVTKLICKNFRCFKYLELSFEKPYVLIYGRNGVGKTSILEALYYGCYVRSFRTYNVNNLILLDAQHFSVTISFTDDRLLSHELRFGFADNKKLIRIDQTPIRLYREVFDYYRVITVTADDLCIIQGAPEVRRNFFDQTIFLLEPEYAQVAQAYRRIVAQKKSLLKDTKDDLESYDVWTKQLWEYANIIQNKRLKAVKWMKEYTNELLDRYHIDTTIDFLYRYKKPMDSSFDKYNEHIAHWYQQEKKHGRPLFGAHLDDIEILFQSKKTRTFVSRGQQKLTLIFLKIAVMHKLIETRGKALFCIDDFFSDFDEIVMEKVFSVVLDLKCQVIITSPDTTLGSRDYIQNTQLQEIKLTN